MFKGIYSYFFGETNIKLREIAKKAQKENQEFIERKIDVLCDLVYNQCMKSAECGYNKYNLCEYDYVSGSGIRDVTKLRWTELFGHKKYLKKQMYNKYRIKVRHLYTISIVFYW